jgi:thiamine pyrophosphate-dependent acetolactate synthase large subunit-like protein
MATRPLTTHSSAAPRDFVLERSEAVPALIGAHDDFLIIAGLGGTAYDVGAVTGDAPHVYSLGGAMGAAAMMGLGLALARPDRRVLVVTGDGDLLMNVGALATIGVIDPPNLAIVCVDNGHYGETGWQKSHTSLGVNLEQIAKGCAIKRTRTVANKAEIADGARLLREGNGTCFVLLRVKPSEPAPFKRNFDAALIRNRFRAALQKT